jgi:hypothetical protein
MTTAKEKIEGLTHSWYGLVVFSAIYSVLENGLGIFSMIATGIWTMFMLTVVWFLGRRLVNRSSLTRVVLVVVSALGTLLGGYAVARMGWAFLHEWSLSLLFHAVFGAGAVALYVRSFRVLTDSSVKAYIG